MKKKITELVLDYFDVKNNILIAHKEEMFIINPDYVMTSYGDDEE